MNHEKTSREAVFAALKKHGPISTPELAKKMKMVSSTVHWHMMKLHEDRRIYVKFYSGKQHRKHMRVWAVGNKADAERGSKFDRFNHYFGDAGGTGEENVDAIRSRLSQIAAQIKPFRHWQDEALFGAAS